MKSDPDQSLLQSWRTGGPEEKRAAFDELYRRYHSKVFSTARHVTGDSNAAADVTQETFLQVFEKFDTFESRSSFSSWLYRIAINFAGEYRRKSRKAPMSLSSSPARRTEAAGMEVVPLEERLTKTPLEADERSNEVQEALLQLSSKLRTVVVLRYIEDLSYEEVAGVLNCSVGTVKSRLSRAHEALERRLSHSRFESGSAGARATS
jgi:RNA polymerase sigma-70 factor (ECF subfamily)